VRKARQAYQQSVSRRFQPSTSILDLFDFKFQKYLTPWVVRYTWICVLSMAAFGTIGSVVAFAIELVPVSETRPAAEVRDGHFPSRASEPRVEPSAVSVWTSKQVLKVVGLIFGFVMTALFVLWVRVVLECVIVIFDISQSLKTMETLLGPLAAQSDGPAGDNRT
jgi:hypothetical protein